MIFPLAHENMEVRRIPLVTAALIALTVIIHVLGALGVTHGDRGSRAIAAALDYQASYSGLPDCTALVPFRSKDIVPMRVVRTPADEDDRDHFKELCDEATASVDGIAMYRFGDWPMRGGVTTLVTYAFLHEGWLHLIGNMWFLFLGGFKLEDRWGRLPFLAFYLSAAVAAALANRLLAPSGGIVVGASGAVAGAMGAFLVLFATERLRFAAILVWRPILFWAPAYVMLPLWLGVETLYALLGAAGDGTAHWVHVGGFAFGVVVAGLFRVLGVDRKLDDAVERAAVLGDDPRIDAARDLIRRNQTEQAVYMLQGLAKEKPDSVHVKEALRAALDAHGKAK